MKRFFIFFLVLPGCFCGYSQKKFDFSFWEDSLVRIRQNVMTAKSETERLLWNDDFMNLLESVLQEPNSFNFTWQAATNFSVLMSPDRLFKIFTWYVEKDNYTVENYGFLQVYSEDRKKYVVYSLYDQHNTIETPEEAVTDHNRWYGAVYYNIIPLPTKNKTYYTLLGWNGNNLFTNQKVIEILHFKKAVKSTSTGASDLVPVFGAKVFRNYPKKAMTRIIFEYNKNSSLSLKYEKQSYPVNTGKRDPKTKKVIYATLSDLMIVFEQTVPMDNSMTYLSAFSVPESSLNQGFVIQEGKWFFLPSVFGRGKNLPANTYKHQNRTFYTPQTE